VVKSGKRGGIQHFLFVISIGQEFFVKVFRDIWIAMWRCPFLLTERFLIPLQLTKGRHNGCPKVVKLHRASNSSFEKEGSI
jgi:hypothetical protein